MGKVGKVQREAPHQGGGEREEAGMGKVGAEVQREAAEAGVVVREREAQVQAQDQDLKED